MSKILITGGAGYIGSHVNKGLHSKGYETVVVDNLSNGHLELVKWGECVVADIGDIDKLREIFRAYDIRAVIHCAAYAYVGESIENPREYYLNNVSNTLQLLEVMLEHDVHDVIFASSCAIYGVPTSVPIRESHATHPVSPYGKSKEVVERVLEDYARAYGLRFITLRHFNAAGADPDLEIGEWHEPETHLIPLVLKAAYGDAEAVSILGTDYETQDGTCLRDFVHVTDLADAYILALEQLLSGGKSDVYNLGGARGFSVREVIETARWVTQKDIPVVERARRPGDPSVLVADSRKARSLLGWEPKELELQRIIETAWLWEKRLRRLNFQTQPSHPERGRMVR